MRGLAEYAMLGRRQAIIIVLLCGFFPLLYFISAGLVGLVTLRKGLNEGLIILLWSLLPAGLLWATGDTTPVMLMTGSAILALVLRKYNSWSLVILLAMVMGLVIQVSLIWQPEYRAQVEQIVNDGLEPQLSLSSNPELSAYTSEDIVELLLSVYGAYHAFALVMCIILARWWQALLYNPGGFQQEFHALRFDPRVMIFLLGLILAGLLDIPPLNRWLPLLCIAPIFGGLAIAHYAVAVRKMGTAWLVLCYITLFMMAPAIILLGLTDSVIDIRKRMSRIDNGEGS